MNVQSVLQSLVALAIVADILLLMVVSPALRLALRRRGLAEGLILKWALLKLWVVALLLAYEVDWLTGWSSNVVWIILGLWIVADPVLSLIWWSLWKPKGEL